jgi:uncharacterized membrane protein YqaE (UPF0057 family)
MKMKSSIAIASLLMLALFTSCIKCGKPVMEENNRYNQSESGFEEETAAKDVINNPLVEKGTTSVSPAADRFEFNDQVEQLEEGNQLEQLADVQTTEKIVSRTEKKNLKRKLKSSLFASKKISKKENKSNGSSVPMILLVILAFLLPWLAVGLHTNWDTMLTVISVILWLLFWVPGIVFALLVIFDVI